MYTYIARMYRYSRWTISTIACTRGTCMCRQEQPDNDATTIKMATTLTCLKWKTFEERNVRKLYGDSQELIKLLLGKIEFLVWRLWEYVWHTHTHSPYILSVYGHYMFAYRLFTIKCDYVFDIGGMHGTACHLEPVFTTLYWARNHIFTARMLRLSHVAHIKRQTHTRFLFCYVRRMRYMHI